MSAIFQVFALTDAHGGVSCHALSTLTTDALGIAGSTHGRMHIMGPGKWEGHPQGPLDITPEYLANIVEQFNAQKNPIPVDYDHSAPLRGDTRAAGWIHSLEIVDGQLWASDVEWTPAAAEAIRTGEYKFNSAFWKSNTKDRVSGEPTGPRLLNVALTNLPFFDGQKPLMCSAIAASDPVTEPDEAKPMNDEFLAAVAKSSGLTPEAVAAALPSIADQIGAMLRDATTAGDTPPPADAPPPEEKKDEEIAASLTAEQAAKIANDAQIKGLLASVAALTATVEKITKADADAKQAAEAKLASERTERIAAMVRDGRLATDEQEDAAKLLAFDAALFDATYKGRKPTVPIGVNQAGNERKPQPGDGAQFTASELIAVQSLQGGGYSLAKARERVIALRQS